MKEIAVASWEEFEERLRALRTEISAGLTGWLYRGQEDASWPLLTTLERRKERISVKDYYARILRVKTEIEVFTGRDWDSPDDEKLRADLAEYDNFNLRLSFGELPAYSYMAYLRHHGFPSPLLDWTRSPYVAAYFAFRQGKREKVALYAYAERPKNVKVSGSSHPMIYVFGPHVKTHRRHFSQRSTYTLCAYFNTTTKLPTWFFAHHDAVFDLSESEQDLLFKFTIPCSERVKVLSKLNEYNLNAVSLFGSEESLMETLAIQEFEFNHR
ncbi:FRG domain-containing protein [Sphingomonas sp.]|uniref:FRG domain-containing protein n=1 Tax=Sphingomonas sp. TaxID=28214 RepID=UPI0025FCF36A|nr:FRG domain-containing protein [Sphingomonas sp.]MBV9528824.1 FRG domain-containing protein [Sphingomonas sp.]